MSSGYVRIGDFRSIYGNVNFIDENTVGHGISIGSRSTGTISIVPNTIMSGSLTINESVNIYPLTANTTGGDARNYVRLQHAGTSLVSFGYENSAAVGIAVYDEVNTSNWLFQPNKTANAVSTFNSTLDDGVGDMLIGGTYLAPKTVNVTSVGTASLPFLSYYLGSSTNSAKISGTFGQVTSLLIPDPGTVSSTNFIISNAIAAQIINSALSITNTTSSSSTATGALIVAGGVGIGGALHGTSANFSAANINPLIVNNSTAAASGSAIQIQVDGTAKANLGWATNGGSGITLYNGSAGKLWLYDSGSNAVNTYYNTIDDGGGQMILVTQPNATMGGLTVSYTNSTTNAGQLTMANMAINANGSATNFYPSFLGVGVQYVKLSQTSETASPWTVYSDGTHYGGFLQIMSTNGMVLYNIPQTAGLTQSYTYSQLSSYQVVGFSSQGVNFSVNVNMPSLSAPNVVLFSSSPYIHTTQGVRVVDDSTSGNVAVGSQALQSISTDTQNVAMGFQAGFSLNGSNGQNTLVGWKSGYGLTTGYYNTYVGWSSGYGLNVTKTANHCTTLGYSATVADALTGAIAIGYDAYNTTSQTCIIGGGLGNLPITDISSGLASNSNLGGINPFANLYLTGNLTQTGNQTIVANVQLATIAINIPGANYQTGDQLTLSGGAGTVLAILTATCSTSPGPITSLAIANVGNYQTIPGTTGVSVTGGHGTGATVNATWTSVSQYSLTLTQPSGTSSNGSVYSNLAMSGYIGFVGNSPTYPTSGAPVAGIYNQSGIGLTVVSSQFQVVTGPSKTIGLTLDTNQNLILPSTTTISSSSNGALQLTGAGIYMGKSTAGSWGEINFGASIGNRFICLYDGSSGTDGQHQFYGFGVNATVLRYQVSSTSNNHVFYAASSATASNTLFTILGTGGATSPNTITVQMPQATPGVDIQSTTSGNAAYLRMQNSASGYLTYVGTDGTGWTGIQTGALVLATDPTHNMPIYLSPGNSTTWALMLQTGKVVRTWQNFLDDGNGNVQINNTNTNPPLIVNTTSTTVNNGIVWRLFGTTMVQFKVDTTTGIQILDQNGNAWLTQNGTTAGHINTYNQTLDDGFGQGYFIMSATAISATVSSGGTSLAYAVNDVITLSGGKTTTPATFLVTAVSGGAVTAVTVQTGGVYQTLPASPSTAISTTGGHGAGCTLVVTWQSYNPGGAPLTLTNAYGSAQASLNLQTSTYSPNYQVGINWKGSGLTDWTIGSDYLQNKNRDLFFYSGLSTHAMLRLGWNAVSGTYANDAVSTYNSTLDDGSGHMFIKSQMTVLSTSNQIVLGGTAIVGGTNTTTITCPTPTANRVYTIPDAGANASFVMSTSTASFTILMNSAFDGVDGNTFPIRLYNAAGTKELFMGYDNTNDCGFVFAIQDSSAGKPVVIGPIVKTGSSTAPRNVLDDGTGIAKFNGQYIQGPSYTSSLVQRKTLLGGNFPNLYDWYPAMDSNNLQYNSSNDIGMQLGAVGVNTGGTGYAASGTISVTGLTDTRTNAVINYTATSGVITAVSIGNQGSYDGYTNTTFPATFTDLSPPGGGTAAVFNVGWGATITSITIVNGGTGWNLHDTFTIGTAATTYSNASGYTIQAVGQVVNVSGGVVTQVSIIAHNNYNSQFYPNTGIACTAVSPSTGTGLTVTPTWGASMPFIQGGDGNSGYSAIVNSFRKTSIFDIAGPGGLQVGYTQAQFLNSMTAQFGSLGTISTCSGYASFGTGYFNGNLGIKPNFTFTADNWVGASGDLRINPFASGQNIYLGHNYAATVVTVGAGSTGTQFQVTNASNNLFLVLNSGSVTSHFNTMDTGSGQSIWSYPATNLGTGGAWTQIGASADFNNHIFGLGVAAPASPSDWPFGVCTGGGTNAVVAFSVSSSNVVNTLRNVLDDGFGDAHFTAQTGGSGVALTVDTSTSSNATYLYINNGGVQKVGMKWDTSNGFQLFDQNAVPLIPFLYQGGVGVNSLHSAKSILDDGFSNFTSVQQAYSTGTVTQSGTTITGSGTAFTSAMVGGYIVVTGQTQPQVITAVSSGTSLTTNFSQTVSSATAFNISYGGIVRVGSQNYAASVNYGGLIFNNNSLSIGRSQYALTGTTGSEINFGTGYAQRMICLYDGGTIGNDDQYQFYGFGVNANIFRYHVATTSASHIFYAATSSSAANTLFTIAGNGTVSTPNVTLDNGSGIMTINYSAQGSGLKLVQSVNANACYSVYNNTGSGRFAYVGIDGNGFNSNFAGALLLATDSGTGGNQPIYLSPGNSSTASLKVASGSVVNTAHVIIDDGAGSHYTNTSVDNTFWCNDNGLNRVGLVKKSGYVGYFGSAGSNSFTFVNFPTLTALTYSGINANLPVTLFNITSAGAVTTKNSSLDDSNGNMSIKSGASISLYSGTINMYANSTTSVQFTSGQNGGTVWLGNYATGELVKTNHCTLDDGQGNAYFGSVTSGTNAILKWDSANGIQLYDGKNNNILLYQGSTTSGRIQTSHNVLDDGSGSASVAVGFSVNSGYTANNPVTIYQPGIAGDRSITLNTNGNGGTNYRTAIWFAGNQGSAAWEVGTDSQTNKSVDWYVYSSLAGAIGIRCYGLAASSVGTYTQSNTLDDGVGGLRAKSLGMLGVTTITSSTTLSNSTGIGLIYLGSGGTLTLPSSLNVGQMIFIICQTGNWTIQAPAGGFTIWFNGSGSSGNSFTMSPGAAVMLIYIQNGFQRFWSN